MINHEPLILASSETTEGNREASANGALPCLNNLH